MSTLSVAAVQMSIDWLDKKANLDYLQGILADIPQTDLIVLPETFATGFAIDHATITEPQQGGEVLSWMRETAQVQNSVIAGSVLVEHKQRKVNRFYWVYPDGQVEYYDKRHLFRLGNEQEHVIGGTQRKIFQVKGVKILPQVCYDMRFPVWSRNRQDYDLIVSVANWPAVRRKAWDALLTARAIENQAYLVGVNRVGEDGKNITHSGGTIIYDYAGEVLAKAQDNQQQVIYAEIDLALLEKFKNKFPFYMDADKFEIK